MLLRRACRASRGLAISSRGPSTAVHQPAEGRSQNVLLPFRVDAGTDAAPVSPVLAFNSNLTYVRLGHLRSCRTVGGRRCPQVNHGLPRFTRELRRRRTLDTGSNITGRACNECRDTALHAQPRQHVRPLTDRPEACSARAMQYVAYLQQVRAGVRANDSCLWILTTSDRPPPIRVIHPGYRRPCCSPG